MTDNNHQSLETEPSKRRLKRHQISGVVEINDSVTQKYLGRLVNIHSEGLMLMGDELLSIDKIYQIKLTLPQTIGGVDSVEMGIDCLWVRESGDDSPHWAGCRIIDASEQVLTLVEQLVGLWGE